MAKKSGSKPAAKSKPQGADYHRKMTAEHSAKARLHSAKADLADAQNPNKKRQHPYVC